MREYCRIPEVNAKKKAVQKALYLRDEPRRRATVIKARYGVTADRYDQMMQEQGGVCAICEMPNTNGRRLAIDHDHKTGVIRGLLCGTCNTSIGHAKDDPDRLRAMADYLERSRSSSEGDKMKSESVN